MSNRVFASIAAMILGAAYILLTIATVMLAIWSLLGSAIPFSYALASAVGAATCYFAMRGVLPPSHKL